MRLTVLIPITLTTMISVGCTPHQPAPIEAASLPPDKSDSSGRHIKVGNPYRIGSRWYYPLRSAEEYSETGIASWYGDEFHGKATANGERYDMHALSAAHTTLPMPTMVRVTNLENGRSVVVRVNDRGPFVKNRLIDLSYAAAESLGFDRTGTARVRVEALTTFPTESTVTPRSAVSVPVSMKEAYSLYIQLGAFSTEGNALKLKSALEKRYLNTNVYTMNNGINSIYKVRVGPFADEVTLEKIILDLQQQGFTDTIVVSE